VLAVCGATLLAQSAAASDLMALPTHKMSPSGPYCVDFGRVAFHPDVDVAKMREIVQEHYAFSKKITEERPIIFSARPTYVWADQTRVYCGMAVGYFEYGELNDEAVGKCECFYQQTLRYLQR
jgi:hypothetical protein